MALRPPANDADARLALKLMAEAAAATLAVIDADGAPYAALTAPAFAADGSPVLLASDLSAHGRALAGDGRASLLFAAAVKPERPLAGARLTLQCRASPAGGEDRDAYLARRPEAARFVDFGDMRLYRLEIATAHLVAGFGRAVSIDPAALLRRGVRNP